MKNRMYLMLLLSILSLGLFVACGGDDSTPNKKTLDVTPNTPIVFESENNENVTLTVVTNAANWIVSAKPTWVTATPDGDKLVVNAEKNAGEERNGNIEIKAGNADIVVISVTQKVKVVPVTNKITFTVASPFQWAAGDKIAITGLWQNSGKYEAYTGSSNVEYTLTSGAGTSSGVFDGQLKYKEEGTAHRFQAIYPATSGASGSIPGEQTYDLAATNFTSNIYPLLLGSVNLNQGAAGEIEMDQMTSLMELTLTNKMGAELTVSSVSLTDLDDSPIAGDYTVAWNPSNLIFTSSKSAIDVAVSNGTLANDASKVVKLVFFPGASKRLKAVITFSDDTFFEYYFSTPTPSGNGIYESEIKLMVGRFMDKFTDGNSVWEEGINAKQNGFVGDVAVVDDELKVGFVKNGDKYFGFINRPAATAPTLYAGTYPIFAFETSALPEDTWVTLDFYSSSAGGGGAYNGGHNKVTVYRTADGREVRYANYAPGSGNNFGGFVLPAEGGVVFDYCFQFKIGDVTEASYAAYGKDYYTLRWVGTFQSVEELKAFAPEQN